MSKCRPIITCDTLLHFGNDPIDLSGVKPNSPYHRDWAQESDVASPDVSAVTIGPAQPVK